MGWTALTEGNTEVGVVGDEPWDIMGNAFDELLKCYKGNYGRAPNAREIEQILNFTLPDELKKLDVTVGATPTVYIVTSGEYSNYGIDAVYTDRGIADRLKELGFRVEEWEANVKVDKFRQGYIPYHCWSWVDDDKIWASVLLPQPVNNVGHIIEEVVDHDATSERRQINKQEHGRWANTEPVRRAQFETWVLAKSEEEMLKIAAERKAKLVYAYRESGQLSMEFK